MQRYKLLRNNIESGPYLLGDLISLPLKAYDLVWAEGKSASWKYPCEIQELSQYAPVAEEDLYSMVHAIKEKTTKKTQTGIYTRKYVSVILPTTPSDQLTGEISLISAPIDFPEITYNSQNSSAKQQYRIYVAGALILLISSGVYFGTSGKRAAIDSTPANYRNSTSLVSQPVRESANITSPSPQQSYLIPPNPLLDFAALKRFIAIEASEYSVGLFGGIYNLKLFMKNTGGKPLKDVVIAVDFLLKDKSIHHTENILVPSLEVGKSLSLTVPNSKKGVAIMIRIIGINGLGTVIE